MALAASYKSLVRVCISVRHSLARFPTPWKEAEEDKTKRCSFVLSCTTLIECQRPAVTPLDPLWMHVGA